MPLQRRITFLNGRHLLKVLKELHGREGFFNLNYNSLSNTLTKLLTSPSLVRCSILIFIKMGVFALIVIFLRYLVLMNQWSPVYDVWAILTSIRSLLCDPNPLSPANSVAAQMFQENKG